MPDTPTAFRLPRPSHPASHHALGMFNAPVFEFDLLEYAGDGGRPLVVVEPRRRDGREQGPFAWFGKRVIEGIGEMYGGGATVVVHETAASGKEVWLITREMPVPVFDDKDEATMEMLRKIQAQAQAGGVSVEAAVHQAVMAGVLKPSGIQMTKALVQIVPDAVSRVLTEVFSHYVEPPAEPAHASAGLIGFAGQAAAQDALDAARRRPGARKPGPARPRRQARPDRQAPVAKPGRTARADGGISV